MGISVFILTKDEELNLPACLETVRWCDDIHVLDSLSSDRTVDIARAAGATVTQRKFDNWSAHLNWAFSSIPFKHEWVLYIDADERVTPGLADSARKAAEGKGQEVAFRVRRRDYFLGTWLKHVQATPYYLRVFKPSKMRYERLVHPVAIPDGPVGSIDGYLDHHPFSKGLADWVDRHNKYSSAEARQILDEEGAGAPFSLRKAFFARDFGERRFHQKRLFYRLPFRPTLKFLILFVAKRGFLDGRAGWTYARLMAWYEYLIVLKTRELRRAPPSA